MVPDREFALKLSSCRMTQLARLGGISPWSLLSDRSSVWRWVRLPSCGETVPTRPSPFSCKAVTTTTRRPAGLRVLPHVTPVHPQNPWVPLVVLFQEDSALRGSFLMNDLIDRSARSWLSVLELQVVLMNNWRAMMLMRTACRRRFGRLVSMDRQTEARRKLGQQEQVWYGWMPMPCYIARVNKPLFITMIPWPTLYTLLIWCTTNLSGKMITSMSRYTRCKF